MSKKGQVFLQYTEDFKIAAVKEYLKGAASYKVVAQMLKIRSSTQLKVWVRKYQNGVAFDTRKGSSSPMKGRPRATFSNIEEERDYLKAQVDYLKKRYPNLVKEVNSVQRTTTK